MATKESAEPTPTLPGAEIAWIPEEKLRGYLLNPSHSQGTHKYRVFRSAFGAKADDPERFAAMILEPVRAGSCRVTGTR
jgi:Domain of unknown function (DUF6883)